jgi:hypothetical protein
VTFVSSSALGGSNATVVAPKKRGAKFNCMRLLLPRLTFCWRWEARSVAIIRRDVDLLILFIALDFASERAQKCRHQVHGQLRLLGCRVIILAHTLFKRDGRDRTIGGHRMRSIHLLGVVQWNLNRLRVLLPLLCCPRNRGVRSGFRDAVASMFRPRSEPITAGTTRTTTVLRPLKIGSGSVQGPSTK